MEIKITCDTKDMLDQSKLRNFQGELKTITPASLKKLKNRIKKSGINVPFFVWNDNGNNWILDGHQRLKAIEELKNEGHDLPDKMPIVYIEASDVNDAREKVLAISSQYGEIDSQYLLNDFAIDLDVKDFRLTNKELYMDYAKNGSKEDDELPNINLTQDDNITKPGTIWTLNKHKLICGSSTEEETYKKLLGNERVNLYVTDPPYNMDYSGTSGRKLNQAADSIRIKNDKVSDTQFDKFMRDFMVLMKRYSDKASYYIFMGRNEYNHMRELFEELVGKVGSDIIWNKRIMTLGGSNYQKKYENLLYAAPGYEKVLYGVNKDEKNYFVDDRSQTDVWEFKNGVGLRGAYHLTMKPVEILTYAIQNSSDYDFIVADIFNGSGSTLIATEKTKRIYRGMELEPRYCDLSVIRWKLWMNANDRKYTILKDGKEFDFKELEDKYDLTTIEKRLEL